MKAKLVMRRTLGALVIVMAGGTAHAGSTADANARLAFADKLSMYSQRIAGSACSYTAPDAPFESSGFLAVASLEINRILNALENGDMALGIRRAEENEEIVEMLNSIDRQWFPIDALAGTIQIGEKDDEYVEMLEQRIDAFTESSFRLVSLVSNEYTDTDALSLADAMRIQVAARKRMLAQKISYEACKIQRDGDPAERERLAETVRFFDRSAEALRDGMPEIGLLPTEEENILSALDKIDSAWADLKWPLLALENGTEWDTETQKRLYLEINELTHLVDQAVVEITKAAKVGG